MFDDKAPIWPFKEKLGATEDPESARRSVDGLFLIEVFPALALLTIDDRFHGRLKAPRYNPARKKTFRAADWLVVLESVAAYARSFGLDDVARWCEAQRHHAPYKADQDKLDSVICALVGYNWVWSPRPTSIMIGDLESGYMISPASPAARSRLCEAATRYGVPIDRGTAAALA
jgi:predicted RNase H-like nuclease